MMNDILCMKEIAFITFGIKQHLRNLLLACWIQDQLPWVHSLTSWIYHQVSNPRPMVLCDTFGSVLCTGCVWNVCSVQDTLGDFCGKFWRINPRTRAVWGSCLQMSLNTWNVNMRYVLLSDVFTMKLLMSWLNSIFIYSILRHRSNSVHPHTTNRLTFMRMLLQ